MPDKSDISTSRFTTEACCHVSDDDWHVVVELSTAASGIYSIHKACRAGRFYVLKALAPHNAENSLYQRLLRKEYDVSRWLNHPGVVRTFGMEHVDGIGECIIMEYIDGITLRDYFSAYNPTRKEAMQIAKGICDALSYLHALQVVHLDLKPSNIMLLRGSNMVKLIDFGFADGPAFVDLKGVGATPKYASPELLEGTGLIDTRSDIYSLGAVMQRLFPSSFWAGQKVAGLCRRPDSAARPASVSQIMPLIDRYVRLRKRWRRVAAVAGVLIAAGGVMTALYEHSPEVIEATSDAVVKVYESRDTVPIAGHMPVDSVADSKAANLEAVDMEPQDAYAPWVEQIGEADLIENQIYAKAMEAAAHRWEGHLAMIDTLRHQRTLDLCIVGYWRHLAKEDVAQWLGSRIPRQSPAFGKMMQIASETIVQYGEDLNRQGVAHEKYKRLYKRTGLSDAALVMRQKLPDGRIRVDSLMEDGHYSIEVGYPEEQTAKGAYRRNKEMGL